MNDLHIDFETYSHIDLSKSGAWRYSEDAEILMCAYALGYGGVRLWIPADLVPAELSLDPTFFEFCFDNKVIISKKLPKDLYDALSCENTLIWAHNAEFETAIMLNSTLNNLFPKINFKDRLRCTMALCASLALPLSLSKAAEALGLDFKKDTAGTALINKFSKPRKPRKPRKSKKPTKLNCNTRLMPKDDPEAFVKFCKYCIRDVEVEREIHHKLISYQPLKAGWDTYALTLEMNMAGLPIDSKTAEKAQTFIDTYIESEKQRCKDICGLSPTQTTALLKYVNELGANIENLQATTLDALIAENTLSEDILEPLRIRRKINMISVKKLKPMIDAGGKQDGRLRGGFVYHGATTGRWAGRLIQPQNFPRPKTKDSTQLTYSLLQHLSYDQFLTFYPDLLTYISSCLRHFIQPKEGKRLIVADYASIEPRVLAVLANQKDAVLRYEKDIQSKHDHFLGLISKEQRESDRLKNDQYIAMASALFRCNPSAVDNEQRNIGKQIVLGCGYGMGKDKFKEQCEIRGVTVDSQLAKKAVETYRSTYMFVRKFWYDVEKLAIKCIKTGHPQKLRHLHFCMQGGFFQIVLPCKRRISYPQAHLKFKKTAWGEDKETIHFYGHIKNGNYGITTTYGGKLVENIVQAFAASIMAHGMQNLKSEKFIDTYKLIGTVHDEALTEVNEGRGSHLELERILCDIPRSWGILIPLEAEGYESKMYKK